jgi:spore maturation protein CgeB
VIFVGPNLSKPNSHFVTNIVSSIGSGDDLLIDLCDHGLKMNEIVTRVKDHCASKSERLVIYNAWEDEKFPLLFRKFFPELQLVTFFSDDEWRHENYDRYLALYSNLFTIAVKDHLPKYRAYGFDNVHYMQWGCNEKNFYPLENEEKIFDVTFIGAAYGKRIDYVKFLKHQGVEIKVFGSGWDKVKEVREYWGGVLTHQGMIKVISQSKINLNFLWTSRGDGNTTIKGRTMEIAACKAFQLSNPTYEFSNYGFVPDENIAVFKDEIDLLKKIQHYINDSHEREKIADNSYRHVLKNLTWKNQFDKVFSRMEMVQTLSV